MLEPGLDKHLWESWWQQFDEDVQTSPGEALSEMDFRILKAAANAAALVLELAPSTDTPGTHLVRS